MNRRFFTSLTLAIAGYALIVPVAILLRGGSASAVEFKFTTVQERATGEVVEQDDIIENFRLLQRERLSSQEVNSSNNVADNDPEATTEAEAGQAENLEVVTPVLEESNP